MRFYSQKYELDIWAYCLMTNHIHLLAVPRQDVSMSRGIGSTNLVYTQYINRKYGRSGRLWQNRFFSTVIDKEPYLWSVARYIENNPVRAGMIKSAQKYKWSSCKGHVSKINNPVLSKFGWLEANEVEAYKEFLRVKDQDTEHAVRIATSTGRPMGSMKFIAQVSKLLGRDLVPKKSGRPRNKEK